VGDTLVVDKADGAIELSWQASPVDGSHGGAAYYELFASVAPDTGYGLSDTCAGTSMTRSLVPENEYYLVSAVNSAGTSGDEPAP
jgi:hypothetical protein